MIDVAFVIGISFPSGSFVGFEQKTYAKPISVFKTSSICMENLFVYLALSLSQLEGKKIIKKKKKVGRTWIGKLHPLKKTKQYQFKEH